MEKNNWEIERLKQEMEEHRQEMKEFRNFKTSTIEKLKTIFERIRELESTNRWMSQSFFYLLGGGVVSAVGALIVWLIQK